MKLFIYDSKHELVHGTLDLGDDLDMDDIDLVTKIVHFLRVEGVTDKYNDLVVASSYSKKVDQDGEDPQIYFENVF
jgi:hypothetical protein